jgi:hypothetical protein
MPVMSDQFAPKLEARLARLGVKESRPIMEAVVQTLSEDPALIAMVENKRMDGRR